MAPLPKVELHVHLEGSVHASTARRLAERHGEDATEVLGLEDGGYPQRFRSFDHFVETFNATARQLRDPADLATAAADFVRHQAEQHVLYTEATFTAVTHVDNGMPPDEMWGALAEGLAHDEVEARLIVDAVREEGPAHGERTVELVRRAPAGLVVGFGLAGVEGSTPESEFTMLREAADELGMGLAVHAGEHGTADNVRAAVEVLGADRLGHGVAALEDADLVAELAERGVIFEVCPSSNVALGVVDSLEEHPLPAMLEAGLAVVIGSDDPPFFSTTLTEELEHAATLCGWGAGDLAAVQKRAARAAFLPEPRREELVATIDAWESETSASGGN